MAGSSETPKEVFKRSERPTVGIEWEVALINPETWDLAHQAEAVINTAQQIQPDIHLEKNSCKTRSSWSPEFAIPFRRPWRNSIAILQ